MLKQVLYLLSWLTLLLPRPTAAHDGASATAVPVAGIFIDGDLHDWPEGLRKYPITFPEHGSAPRNSSDFQAWFRVVYSPSENALYLAVEVEDAVGNAVETSVTVHLDTTAPACTVDMPEGTTDAYDIWWLTATYLALTGGATDEGAAANAPTA